MNTIQFIIISLIGIISLLSIVKGIHESIIKKNPFGQPFLLYIFGIFVWGDAVVLGLFWFLTSSICLLFHSLNLFLLIVSIFWIVRSFGEIIYWINQQFSPLIRNPPENLFGHRFFSGDSVWFIYQLFWQCVLVVSIVVSIFILKASYL